MITLILTSLLVRQSILPQVAFVRTVDRTDGVSVSQTMARKLVAPGKPDVWLVGAAHIGAKQYYADLQELLDAQDTVLYEGVRSQKQPKAPPKADPNAPKQFYQVLSDAIGLDFQLVDINYNRPHWINSDLTMEQLDAINSKAGKGKPTMFNTVEQMLQPGSPQAKMMTSFFQSAPPSIKEAFKIFLVDKISKMETMLTAGSDPATIEVLLTARNKSVEDVFAQVMAGSEPPKSVGIFYGAAHLYDIQKALAAKYGYQATEQRWFTFAKADHKKLDATGKQFLDTLNKMLPKS